MARTSFRTLSFAQAVSWRLLRKRTTRREITGMGLLAVALVLVLTG